MSEILITLLSAVLGVALSLIFVGGLWWTLQRVQQRQWPAYAVVLSYLLRLSVVAAGFIAIAWGGHWQRLLVTGIAFALTRPLWVRRLARHAPPHVRRSYAD